VCAYTGPATPPTAADTDPEMPRTSDLAADEPISLPTWAGEADPLQPIPSHSRYEPPEIVVTSRRRARSVAAWYADAAMGHSIGLGYLVLTLRELSGLSQSRLAARADTSQPAIARLESGRHVPSVNTLLKIASSCGMHLVVGLADPALDVADLCMHDLTLLGILRPSSDELPDFFVIRELPPWVGEG
jgi:transcriptional regulator with XRE-family HTH domain